MAYVDCQISKAGSFIDRPDYKVLVRRKRKIAPNGLEQYLYGFYDDNHVDLSLRDRPVAITRKLMSPVALPMLGRKEDKLTVLEHKIDVSPFFNLHFGY
jgi:hypothetical protein